MIESEILTIIFFAALNSILGFQLVTIIDKLWFEIDYKKTEKGLEVLEHYHYGIALIAIAIILIYHIPYLAIALLGAGAAFIYHESKQKNYFAHKSPHFKGSTIIGIILMNIAILSYVYVSSFLN